MRTYQEKIADLQQELARIDEALIDAPGVRRGQLIARRASVRRSMQWYQKRLPRRLGSLSVAVSDRITTAERLG